MPQIDPTRLSRIFTALTQPRQQVEVSNKQQVIESVGGQKNTRKDAAVLRANVKSRLLRLRNSTEDFDAAAPRILVQEILRWEFGDDILEHSAFEQAVAGIAFAVRANLSTHESMTRLIAELSSD